ncbi:hypothetical protein XBJ1_2546 [Xenorhabdus bovienii SS-2004]|uniref:Uncharacterized protein n=1 Tax=Xenorhabdus bovienii (strain SS-2004) TaxID=406818 RepID=D3V1X6_XENBS|nr:hypothetical protein XBJ1_2546 [Xenorhabdus bovienii SS-2004]
MLELTLTTVRKSNYRHLKSLSTVVTHTKDHLHEIKFVYFQFVISNLLLHSVSYVHNSSNYLCTLLKLKIHINTQSYYLTMLINYQSSLHPTHPFADYIDEISTPFATT